MGGYYVDANPGRSLIDYDDYAADGILDGRGWNGEKLTGGSWYAEHPETASSGSGKSSSKKTTGGTSAESAAKKAAKTEPTVQEMLDALERIEQQRRKDPAYAYNFNNKTMV